MVCLPKLSLEIVDEFKTIIPFHSLYRHNIRS